MLFNLKLFARCKDLHSSPDAVFDYKQPGGCGGKAKKIFPAFTIVIIAVLIGLTLFSSCATAAKTTTPAQAEAPSQKVEPPQEPAVMEEATPLKLSILHVNDTHSKLEPTIEKLTMNLDDQLKEKAVYVELGGFPQLQSAEELLKKKEANTLFLHAGDMFQGTLYFTKYQGEADVDFWNLMKVDAATLGNHEFDKGPEILQMNLLNPAGFLLVSANVDVSREPLITDKSKIKPYVIKEIGGGKVGIIGICTVETPFISSPGKNIGFNETVVSVQQAVADLTSKSINKIVLLSHQGYSEDMKLATVLSGVDIIVGGHSHTLLGDFSGIGLASAGGYPAKVKDRDNNDVLIVQAGEWGKILGHLKVQFDEKGQIVSYEGVPKAVVGKSFFRIYDLPNLKNELKRIQFTVDPAGAVSITEYDGKAYNLAVKDDPNSAADQYDLYKTVYDKMMARLSSDKSVILVDPNPEGKAKLQMYAEGVNQLKGQVVAAADEDLIRSLNKGSGPIIADGMAWKTGADIAVNNPGGVRININQGPISVATVFELLPFANRLVTVPLKGSDVINVLEDGVDFQVSRYGTDPNNPFLYVSGIKFSIAVSKSKGGRIQNVVVKDKDGKYSPINVNATYKVVVNNFMADGGDKNDTLKNAAGKYDTGFNDAEVFMEYIKDKRLKTIAEERITLIK
ncbi:MAG: 5'-nucleotidase C-terminal domain-containing protein [Spirochaetota bacterium]